VSLQPHEPQSENDVSAQSSRGLPWTGDLVPQDIVTKDALKAWMAEQTRREQLVLQGQIMGLTALFLMLVTVVVLAVLGFAWVSAILAGTSLVAIVTAFITAQYAPSPVPPRIPIPRLPTEHAPGAGNSDPDEDESGKDGDNL
jgi:hypothetical protein